MANCPAYAGDANLPTNDNVEGVISTERVKTSLLFFLFVDVFALGYFEEEALGDQ